MKYFVFNHHDFWQYPLGESDVVNADVVFMWADWPFSGVVKTLQSLGKKVIVYEHGFGALWDYELNNREPMADGYLALGEESKKSLVRKGVSEERVLVSGNPIYDSITIKEGDRGNKALFVALHWVSDRLGYNSDLYEQLKKAYPQLDWTLKLSSKTADFSDGKKWFSNVDGSVLEEIKEKLPRYDYVFTPRVSTFETFARFMGIPVYVLDQEETYRASGDPGRVPMNYTFLKVGDPLPEMRPINNDDYIKRPSASLEDILKWCKQL